MEYVAPATILGSTQILNFKQKNRDALHRGFCIYLTCQSAL